MIQARRRPETLRAGRARFLPTLMKRVFVALWSSVSESEFAMLICQRADWNQLLLGPDMRVTTSFMV